MRDSRKTLHFISTAWFIVAVFYVLVTALRNWGVNWLVIFSLSGHSILIALLLISFYLFAIYRGVVRNENTEPEHPLSRTKSYMIFYDISPLLGGLAGLFATVGTTNLNQSISIITIGTFVVTFVVWIIIDPAIGLVEIFLPKSIRSRRERVQRRKQFKIEQQQGHRELLIQLVEKQQEQKKQWQLSLASQAGELAAILSDFDGSDRGRKTKIIDIGFEAWQRGGENCMNELYEMALNSISRKPQTATANYLAIIWDGIGTWKIT